MATFKAFDEGLKKMKKNLDVLKGTHKDRIESHLNSIEEIYNNFNVVRKSK
jgi:hypothetical protein